MTRPRVLVINGPNLNWLGRREPAIYGRETLAEIEASLRAAFEAAGVEAVCFQSNHEGALIDFLQAEVDDAIGVIINPGALSHYGLSLQDALASVEAPIVEVHLSNIHGREEWRRRSVTAETADGVIAGLGSHGYHLALEAVLRLHRERTQDEEARARSN